MKDQGHAKMPGDEAARVLGLVADPGMPTRVASRLSSGLTDWLTERTIDNWTVKVVSDPVTTGEPDPQQILRSVSDYVSAWGWEYAICLTELPLLLDQNPLLANVSTRRKVALVSLPALGGLQPYRRTWQMLTQLLEELLTPRSTEQQEGGW